MTELENLPPGTVVMAQGRMDDLPSDEAPGPIQFVEEGLVPHEVFTKRLKFALDGQAEDGGSFEAIHHLLREAKRQGIVTLSLIHSMMLGGGGSVVMSVKVEVPVRGASHRREYEASPDVVRKLLDRHGHFGSDEPGWPIPRHSLA